MVTEAKLACIKSYEEGLALYRVKDFKNALEKFKEALTHDPTDQPSKVFIERCRHFIQYPVGDDWDGVFEMKTK